ncbi:MAG: TIGR01777 family oxidoreductase [Bacteriovorax sp.]|nr:TIGR01777 family oxidoreductase [Bacteriovorax sp.]
MKILITGATGFIGKRLTAKLLEKGFEINVLTRDKQKAKKLFPQEKVLVFAWKNNLELPPIEAFEGISGIINLKGENIGDHRWSKNQKKKFKESRVDSTINLVKQIEQTLKSPLNFFIQASAVGIYPVNTKKVSTEDDDLGTGFLAELCKKWEGATASLTKAKRKVIIRNGIVLEKNGGVLKKMHLPFKLGIGGPIGNGNQMISWIHLDDLVNIYANAIDDERFVGVINAMAPTPVSNFDFTKALGHALHRPTLIPIPKLVLKIVLGEMASIILESQMVTSKRLLDLNFYFQYPTVDKALNAIFERKEKAPAMLRTTT